MDAGSTREELLELLGALADRSISADEHRRLEQILAEDAPSRQVYFDYLDVHFGLHRWTLQDEETEPLEELRSQLALTPAQRKRPVWLSLPVRFILVIAATLCVSLLAQFLLFPARQSELGAAVTKEYLATLRRTADCWWDRLDAGWREGSRLLPQEIGLRRGVAEILFDGGTQLILEGPATLKIESASSAALLRGKAVVKTDETAEPFALATPSATLIHDAAEYAVAVDPSGEEVHVFDGLARREPRTAAKSHTQPQPDQIAAGNARKYARATPSVGTDVALGASRFVRQVPHRTAVSRDVTANLLAYEGFDYPTGTLSAGEFSDFGWESPWRGSESADAMLNASESLVRPGAEQISAGGSLGYAGAGAVQRTLATPLRLDQDGVYYFSFLFRRHRGSGKSPGTFLMTLSNAKQAEPQKRLVLGITQPGHVLFANLEGGGVRTPLPLDYEKTYLLVGKIVAGRKKPEQIFLRIYRRDEPVERREPASWSVTSRPVLSDLVLDTLAIQINSQSRQAIDELRIGTTWSSATSAWAK